MSGIITQYFIRRFGSSQFVSSKEPIFDIQTIPVKTDALARTVLAFCSEHRQWEPAAVGENSVRTACGSVTQGTPVEIADKPSAQEENYQYLNIRKKDIKRRNKFVRNLVLTDYHTYLLLDNSIKNARAKVKNHLDEKGAPKDIVSFTLTTSERNHSFALTFQTLNRELTDSHLFNPLRPLPLKNNTIQGKIGICISARTTADFNIEFPASAMEQLHSLLNSYAGKLISFNTCIHGEELLTGICRFPYEPNIIRIVNTADTGLKFSDGEENSSDIYNIVCNKLGIKSYRSLRKAFYTNPLCLLLIRRLKEYSFTDTNIIQDILCNEASVQFLQLPQMPQKFFTQWLIKERGERPAWNVLKKADWKTEEYSDALIMFNTYFALITPAMREDISKDGLTLYQHDILAKLAIDAETQNVPFTYSPEQRSLECNIDGYDFMLPLDSQELRNIGSNLHNCVASYKKRVLDGRCIIVFAKKDRQYRLCIELRGKDVWQQRADRNATPVGEDLKVLTKWERKHQLTFSENRF